MGVTLIILPVNIAFYSDQFSLGWTMVTCFTDSFFLIDMVLNFTTGIVDRKNEEVILSRKTISKRYLRTWFVPDLISSFPFDYIYIFIKGEGDSGADFAAIAFRIFRLGKILGILRLLRLLRLMRYINKLEEILNIEGTLIRVVNLCLIVLLTVHWNACIQYFISFAQGYPPDSWVSLSSIQDAGKWEKYSWSFFKAICHTLGVGFGRYLPENKIELWAASISLIIGASYYALFVGEMATLMLSIDSSGRVYNDKIHEVKEYMRYRKLPAETQKRVLDYYERRYQRKYFDEESILNEQNEPIRREITEHLLRSLVKKVDFLNKGSQDFVFDVIDKLKFEVYLKGDIIVKAGRLGNAMYFIEHGVANIEVEGQTVGTLTDGDHFGEIALLVTERRVATVTAKTTCDIYCLSREDFDKVVAEYDDMRMVLSEAANERLQKISDSKAKQKSQTPEQKQKTQQDDTKQKQDDKASSDTQQTSYAQSIYKAMTKQN